MEGGVEDPGEWTQGIGMYLCYRPILRQIQCSTDVSAGYGLTSCNARDTRKRLILFHPQVQR